MTDKKVVMITGGARGIGKCLVEAFYKAGYAVTFCYNNSYDKAIELINIIKSDDVVGYKADVTNEVEVNDFVKRTISHFGHIDVLINNSATVNDSLFVDKTSKTFMDVLNTNLVGAFNVSKLVGDIMYKQKIGKIINISSTNGINTYFPMCLEYDASKAGLNSLTHNLAMQFAPYVNVNAIAPGFIATESEVKDMDEDYIREEEQKVLLKRAGTEEDVCNLALFLASDKANYINNQIIKINGGFYGD